MQAMIISSIITARSLRVVCHGSEADVRMNEASYSEYIQAIDGNDKISVQRRTRLGRYFTEFSNYVDYFRRMGQDQFKKEGNFPDGHGGSIAVWAFKAFQWRLYGGMGDVAGRRCFVGVAVDSDKKRDRADQELLKTAAKRLGEFFEFTSRRTEGRRR